MIKKILLSPWMALVTLMLVVGVRVSDSSFVESVRLRYFDQLITSQPATQNNIYTVNIDEATLDKYGQWPLPRNEYAELIERLYERGAGLVVWNIIMPEPDRGNQDGAMAYALNQHPVILGAVPSAKMKNEPRQVGVSVMRPEFSDRIVQYSGLISNVPALNSQAAGVGIINVMPEIDGVNRRLPLVVSVNDILYPSMALETLRVAAGDPSFQIKLNENGVEKMRIPKFGQISTDNLGRIWIDWSQTSKSVSAVDLPKDFGGAIVIVGTSAAGIGNPVPTSKGAVWPQDVQASVIGTMINGVNIERPDWADSAEILALILLGVIIIFSSRWTYAGIAISVIIIGSIVPCSLYSFTNYKWLIDATSFVFGGVLVMLHCYGSKFISEFLQKQQIKKQFGSYVNPAIVAKLQKNPDLIKLGGEKKMLSIVMTDLRGFTTLGESFGDDVEGLTQIMNDYMTALSIPVLKNDGTLIKFIGDASLHVHGAPLDDDRHAFTAVKTAQQMIKAIEEFNKELQVKGKPPVGMGAGVNTGETLIGNIGAKSKFGYDVLGDSVSTAARLEGQTKSYGVLLIIGPHTNDIVKDEIFTLELDNIAVKGKTVGLRIYTPLEVDINAMPEYLLAREQHNAMLAEYRAQKFDTAITMCHELMGEFDGKMDHSYELWIERCELMKTLPLPADWDGVYRATTK